MSRKFSLQAARRDYPRAAAPLSIPWSVAEKAYGMYVSIYGRGQSLERLAERGGFSVEEMDNLYPPWRDEVSEIEQLRAALLPFATAASRPGRLLDSMTGQQLPDDVVLGLGVKVAAWKRANELMGSE